MSLEELEALKDQDFADYGAFLEEEELSDEELIKSLQEEVL